MVKLCKCGHRKGRHQSIGRSFPHKCIDCNKDPYHSFQEPEKEFGLEETK